MKGIKINAFKLNGSENEMTVLFGSGRERQSLQNWRTGKMETGERKAERDF